MMKYLIAIVALISIALAIVFSMNGESVSANELVSKGRDAIRTRDLSTAQQVLQKALQQSPDSGEALLLLGEVYLRQKLYDEAIQQFQLIQQGQKEYPVALYTIGEIQREQLALSEAEATYLECLHSAPKFIQAHERLALIKRLTGRPGSAEIHLRELLSQAQISTQHLAWLAAPERLVEATDFLKAAHAAHPDDPLPLFGLGFIELKHGHVSAAVTHLRNGLNFRFDPEAMAHLGRCLVTQNQRTSMQDWIDTVPASSRSHPELQFVYGLIAELWSETKIASGNYASCLQRAPNHKGALTHLAALLNNQNKEQKQAILDVVSLLSRLETIVASLDLTSVPPGEAIQQIVWILLQLGRTEEAIAWSGFAMQQVDTVSVSRAVNETRQFVNSYSPASTDWQLANGIPTEDPTQTEISRSNFFFRNDSQALGVDFQYFESPDPNTEGRRMFEFTGGGVGVMDFDVDGLPDLYFTQGKEWPTSERPPYLDALYRNLGTSFHRVDRDANVFEPNFSQGVAVGDLNNDGFDDLYVANLGVNQLLLNNGDGTFANESESIPPDSEWTTSCVIADVNNDSSPDIFDVNYLTGDGLDSKICQTPAGPRVCSPLVFEPAEDRLLLSSGNFEFVDATQKTGLNKPGNGLGIVVANLDADPAIELFIANDMMENFFWDPVSHNDLFQDAALINGWALGSEGESQACMGVAVGDLNGDTTTDLFVTNYFNESNALYLAAPAGFVSDQSIRYGIRGPSLPMLGFGTQALDADLDGDLDLFVVNGDLDDFSHEQRSLYMSAQLFENVKQRTFIEFKDFREDDYLAKKYRGRGLAKFDHNRDGRWDLAVSHLDTFAAVVTNLSTQKGYPLRLKVVGTDSSRNAVGAAVKITFQDANLNQIVRRQSVTAGDGYQASNERLLVFSIEHHAPIKVEIQWPSGILDVWDDVRVRVDTFNFVAIEGQKIYPLPSN